MLRFIKRRKHIGITIFTIAILILAILILIPTFVMSMFLGERIEQKQRDSMEFGIESEQISLFTEDDLALAAWRTYTQNEILNGTVIIVSGLQEPSVTAFFGYANMFAEHGWDSLLIEKRARSLSEGDSIGFGTTEWRDVKAGVDFLAADMRVGDFPIIALGTSAGGATAIIAGGEVPRIDGVIAISAYADFVGLYVDSLPTFGLPRFVGVLTTPFIYLNMWLRLGFDAISYTPINGIVKLGERPILLMHSTNDRQVRFSHFEQLYQTAKDADVAVTAFVREGNWHFVCYDHYTDTPVRDAAFTEAVLAFLGQFTR
ncbi:MAG: prolyl oligopeptidase family serine peptidase [Oscillospiraceae bacterium]|nr:prolyl oligopeptidase family serine peptidase [Oscillospiraceae bacterium]